MILKLNLYKKWFDLIESGEKTEEYRALTDYWINRFSKDKYKVVEFANGYRNPRKMTFEIESIRIGIPKQHISDMHDESFIIKLGKRIS